MRFRPPPPPVEKPDKAEKIIPPPVTLPPDSEKPLSKREEWSDYKFTWTVHIKEGRLADGSTHTNLNLWMNRPPKFEAHVAQLTRALMSKQSIDNNSYERLMCGKHGVVLGTECLLCRSDALIEEP